MKKIALLLALISCATFGFAQGESGSWSIIPRVGLSLSTINGDASLTGAYFQTIKDNSSSVGDLVGAMNVANFADNQVRASWLAGVDLSRQLTRHIAFQAGISYTMKGASYDDTGSSVYQIKDAKFTLHTLNVPILLKVYVLGGLAAHAGVQPSFNLTNKLEYDAETAGVKTHFSEKLDGIKKAEFSIPIGVSYEFLHIILDARYDIGVTNIFDIDESIEEFKGKAKGRNGVFTISAGFRLGKGR